jgi:hypothetical protein
MRAITRTRVAKGLLIAFTTLTTALVITMVVFSIIQTQETSVPSNVYDGSLCHDSVLNDYRPFRLYVAPKVSAANQTTYKLCIAMRSGSSGDNETVLCVLPPAPKVTPDEYNYKEMVLQCAWDGPKNTARRLGITIACIFVPIFLIVWVVKESTAIGKIFGFLFLLLALAATVGFGWLMITDADSVRKGFDFCKANYIDGTMCNPVKYTHTVREECTCDFINFISITLMDAGGIVLWIFVAISAIFRFCAYRYSDEEILVTATEAETAPVISENERHASLLASSYGYKAEEKQPLTANMKQR